MLLMSLLLTRMLSHTGTSSDITVTTAETAEATHRKQTTASICHQYSADHRLVRELARRSLLRTYVKGFSTFIVGASSSSPTASSSTSLELCFGGLAAAEVHMDIYTPLK